MFPSGAATPSWRLPKSTVLHVYGDLLAGCIALGILSVTAELFEKSFHELGHTANVAYRDATGPEHSVNRLK